MKRAEREMIHFGRLLFERHLISGWGGNLSCRLAKEQFLITGQHAPLGFLKIQDLVRIDSKGRPLRKTQHPSSETTLHLAVYKGSEAKAIVHAHPPKVLAFSLSHASFVPVSFEEKYTLGEIPVLPQETPTVTDTAGVVEELKLRPIVILRGHGTVAIGKDLKEAFLLTDLLEEAVQCQLVRDQIQGGCEPELERSGQGERKEASKQAPAYPLFSREHIEALIESANGDAEFQRQARAENLTTALTLRLEEAGAPWSVHFDNGRIVRWEAADDGEFVISGKREWWEAVFKGRIDPFLATQQGKLKLERGELWKLSQWFKPFQRAFYLWQNIPIE